VYYRSYPGIIGSQETHCMQVIHQLLLQSLSDPNKNVREIFYDYFIKKKKKKYSYKCF
jgi:hypothetical protein